MALTPQQLVTLKANPDPLVQQLLREHLELSLAVDDVLTSAEFGREAIDRGVLGHLARTKGYQNRLPVPPK